MGDINTEVSGGRNLDAKKGLNMLPRMSEIGEYLMDDHGKRDCSWWTIPLCVK